MTSLDISKLKRMFAALNNEKRIRIIELCSEREFTVSQISKKIELDYSVTVEYISMLEKSSLVSKKRNEDKTVSVKSLITISNDGAVIFNSNS